MRIEVKVPIVGESITEGLLAEWLKRDGEMVATDEPVFVLETDKVTLTVNAEHAGKLAIAVAAGEAVKIGQTVGTINAERESGGAGELEGKTERASGGAGELAKKKEEETKVQAPSERPSEMTVPQSAGPAINPIAGMPSVKAHLAAMGDDDFPPAVRRMIEEYRIDPKDIQGTGRGGRLTKEDVVAFLARTAGKGAAAPQGAERESGRRGEGEKGELESWRAGELAGEKERENGRTGEGEKEKAKAPVRTGERQTRTALTPIRARIAERVLLSQKSTATLTTFNEADLGALVDLRKRSREAFKAQHGVDLTYLPFFVRAVSDALDAVPELASWIEAGELVRNNYRDIGIAVASEQGLAVPVLRDVESKSIPELQREIDEVARRVRERRITLEDLKGAVFSITNAGSYGALMGTPILNPPQSGILGMYAIQERPVAREGQVVIRPMMYLALSYDHRVVDGKAAGTFLKHVAETVANPARFLLGI